MNIVYALLNHSSNLLAQGNLLFAMLQPAASSPGKAAGKAAGEGVMPAGGCAANIGLTLLMVLVFYFLILRPQQKRQKQHESLVQSLQRGTVVRTTGGLRGEIVDVGAGDVTLQIADRVKVNILKSNIQGLDVDRNQGKTSESGVTKASKA